MEINRFVVHELIKFAKKTKEESDAEPQLVLSEHLADKGTSSNTLIEEVHRSFSANTGLKHTNFEDRNDKVFKKSIEAYVANMSDELFLKFSVDSLKALKEEIQKEPFATGGYYVFADYTLDSKQFISVILLRKRPGLNLLFKDRAYVVSTTENLNIDKIAMGFRLNIDIYTDSEDQRSYIALITTQQDKLSGYFKDWVAAAGVISDEKNTGNLVKIIKNIDLPLDENGNEKYSRDEFQKVCFDFIDQHPDKRVSLKALSIYLYGEDNDAYIVDYANQNQIQIDNEFRRNSQVLHRLITIKAKVKGIELNVDYDKLNENEVDVQKENNMIIIRSKDLVEQILKGKDGPTSN